MKNKRTGKQVVISVLIVVVWAALGLMTGTRRVLSAATFTVTNTSDCVGAGCGSLRQAIIDANATAGADTINFQAGVTGTITLGSALPQITQDLTITGAGVVTVSGASAFQVFNIASAVTVSISDLTIANGSAAQGGGIFNNGGILTVTNSTFSGNSAGGFGGGIFNQIFGTLTVTNCTFSGNSALVGGGGVCNSVGTLTVTNSTFSGNSAGNEGAGVFNGITGSAATFKNSIVANSLFGGNCGGIVAITPAGVNFSTDNTCGAGFTVVPSTGAGGLNLGPLQDNGGPTYTHALLPGSIAIDAVVPPADCNDLSATPAPVTTDQRGLTRPQDGDGNGSALCDAGAFELQPCTIICPANITHPNDPNQCGAVINYPAPTTSGDLDCGRVSCSPASDSFFPVGMTTVTCTTTAGPNCTFTVTVNDTQAPTITCPANITVATDPNQCSAVVSYKVPTPTDNCPGVTATCVPASGSTFPKGTTTVTCTATDSSNNTGSCTFTVTVNDTQPPTITCPANITVATDPNQCSAVVSYTVPTPTDNCPGVTATCVPASGSTFLKGTTTVTCTATDSSNNTASCTFTVTVNDTQPPTITCPANVTAVAAQTCPISSSATVNFPAPTVSDNCPGVTSVCTPPSGSIFPVGTTTVTCTATDTSGNTATCTFTVTVFSGCLQDDSNPANVVLFNAASGEYRFCCGGTTLSGVGTVLVKGCIVTIQHYPADRRVLIKFDGAVGAGTASLQSPPGTIRCTIMDRNTRNNTCACQ